MRLRFAPSPTGFLHIGNARTAIINHILAQKGDHTLVLRVEDTDRERSSLESEKSILDDLAWLGIQWHEGPDVGGDYGPYRQSERDHIYKEYTEKLVSDKKAYRCYCTSEELESIKKEAIAAGKNSYYDGRCRHLSEEQIAVYESEGRSYTVRFAVPENEDITFNDLIKKEVSFNSNNIGGDFIIVRSDGGAVYNYIVVIDDALMKIDHVVRGEDHLSNTPKQILIARALGFELPAYAHMPLVMGEDKKKLSKRHGITSVNLYREEGYLPEALVNYIAVLGWALSSGEEIASQKTIISEFSLDKLGSSGAVFDFKKLKWMNGNYIRSKSSEELLPLFAPYMGKAGFPVENYDKSYLLEVIDMLKKYCELLSEIGPHLSLFLNTEIEYSEDAKEVLGSEEGKAVIECADKLFTSELDFETFFDIFVDKVKTETGLKGKKLFMPCRSLITGQLHGPDLGEAMKLIGFENCKARVEKAKNLFL